MRYKIGQSVILQNCKTEKKISDVEKIENVVIYYMTDNTSFSESQIFCTKKNYKKIKKVLTPQNINNLIDYLDNGNIAKGYERLMSGNVQ
jgi:hypothetical protein